MSQFYGNFKVKRVVSCCSLYTLSANNVVILKLMCGVQLESCHNLRDCSCVGSLDIKVIYRTRLGNAVVFVTTYDSNDRIACRSINGYHLGHTSFIALVIKDNEGNAVFAVCKVNIIQRDVSVGSLEAVLSGSINAVHIDLCSSVIETGHIAVTGNVSYLCIEGKKVAVNSLTVQ